MVTMLIMKLPWTNEAEPVEAVPMAAARKHKVHVVSSAPPELCAVLRDHHVVRMTSAAHRAVPTLS